MPDYILDTCVDIDPKHANYPAYFFRDLNSNIRVRIVVGGTKVSREIGNKTKLRDLLNNLKDRNQVVQICSDKVDASEESLSERIAKTIGNSPQECDDLHIFALALVSGCLNVISRDNRMAICRGKIRNTIGHDHCANIKVLQNEEAYKRTK